MFVLPEFSHLAVWGWEGVPVEGVGELVVGGEQGGGGKHCWAHLRQGEQVRQEGGCLASSEELEKKHKLIFVWVNNNKIQKKLVV